MDIQKKVETTFTIVGINDKEMAAILKAIKMARTVGRVRSVRLSLAETRALGLIAEKMEAQFAPVIPREMIEDEPEEDENFNED